MDSWWWHYCQMYNHFESNQLKWGRRILTEKLASSKFVSFFFQKLFHFLKGLIMFYFETQTLLNNNILGRLPIMCFAVSALFLCTSRQAGCTWRNTGKNSHPGKWSLFYLFFFFTCIRTEKHEEMASGGMKLATPAATTAVNQSMRCKRLKMPKKDGKTPVGMFIAIMVFTCLNNIPSLWSLLWLWWG